MKFIFSPPSLDDLINLLKAWRFWILGAMIGALLGAALYFIAPPPYRAQATVNVDFNLEEAFPTDNDRQHFYYLERETRKMIEIAWSNEVIHKLSSFIHIQEGDLRQKYLYLSQPAEAGWHFYADFRYPDVAQKLASIWAHAFVEKIQAEIESGNVNKFVRLEVTQTADLPAERSIPLSSYLLTGASLFLLLTVFVILFIKPKK